MKITYHNMYFDVEDEVFDYHVKFRFESGNESIRIMKYDREEHKTKDSGIASSEYVINKKGRDDLPYDVEMALCKVLAYCDEYSSKIREILQNS